jgi:glycosyltransferase involved in cell wall biosynthesis
MTAVDSRIDVLLAVPYDPDVRVRRETQALADAGARVRILAWDRTGDRPISDYDGRVLVQRVGPRSTFARGASQLFFFMRLWLTLLPLIRRRRPDVLHAIDLPMLVIALAAWPLVGRPAIVYDAFEVYSVMVSHRLAAPLVKLIGMLETNLPRLANLVITPGDLRRSWFEDHGISSISIPNWVDRPQVEIDRAEARARLGIAEQQFCLVYAGALHRSRDLAPLLEHAQRFPRDVVVIAGRGDAEADLAEAARAVPNVRLMGWQADPSEVLLAADALYYALRPDHPYALLAVPNNLFVAISWAIPLIHRNQGEIGEVAAHHNIGVAFGDANSISDAVDVLRDAAVREAVRDELRRIGSAYSWPAAARRLVDAYARKGLASSRPRTKGP